MQLCESRNYAVNNDFIGYHLRSLPRQFFFLQTNRLMVSRGAMWTVRRTVPEGWGSEATNLTMHGHVKLFFNAQYTPPRRLNLSRVGVGVSEQNSQLAHDDCRRIRSTIWKLTKQTPWLFDYMNFARFLITFSTMTSSSRHLSPTAQEIVNWVTTTDGCVHTAHTAQLSRVVVGGVYWA